MLLAFDDTDSPEGGCTTALVRPIVEALGGEDVLAGLPRLVRLDPAHPWKTRGNAAVVVPLTDDLDGQRVLDAAFQVVERKARLSEGKGAGVVVLEEPPDERWYWHAVQGPVRLDEVRAALAATPHRTLGTGRGLVGALCAAAWHPRFARGRELASLARVPAATYEHIAYRERGRWGTPREVDSRSLAAVQRAFSETFDCVDERGRPVMVPHTPCPVLYGLRATRPDRLAEAACAIESEPVAAATTFVTNHASDDHVTDACLTWLTLTERPRARPGGHVVAPARTDEGERRDCIAFEPTGSLRHAVLAMRAGDRVLPVGSMREGSVNLEKVLHAPVERRARTPCPSCGRAMTSVGRDGPVRCRACGRRQPAARTRPQATWHEADAGARRHLARPLSLGLAERIEAASTPHHVKDARPA